MSASTKLLHWLPRTLCILAILFVSMFALDAFAPGLTIWQQLGAFLIHLIPSFVPLALLLFALKPGPGPVHGVGTSQIPRNGEDMKASTPRHYRLLLALCIVGLLGCILASVLTRPPGVTIWQQLGAFFAELVQAYNSAEPYY